MLSAGSIIHCYDRDDADVLGSSFFTAGLRFVLICSGKEESKKLLKRFNTRGRSVAVAEEGK